MSLADALYIVCYLIVIAALLLFQSASAVRRETLRLAIDSLIVFIGGGIVVWHTLFRPTLESLDPDPIVAALALGYPILDLVLLAGVAATALRRPADVDARALTALVGGLGLMFVGAVGYGQLNLIGSSDVERWPDAVFMTSTLLFALAGFFQGSPRPSTERAGRMMSRWLLLLPYVGLAAGYSVLVALAQGSVNGELAEVLYGAIA